MKKFIFKVTLATGMAFTCTGIGFNQNEALMDACWQMSENGEYPEDEIECIDLLKQEGEL